MRHLALLVTAAVPSVLLAHGAFAPAAAPGDDWTQPQLENVTRQIQKEIEELRGEAFERGVAVRLTDGAGFLKHATQRAEEMMPPEMLSAEQDLAVLLGLIPADMDLWKTTLALLEGQVGGFYDPSAETFYLMEGFTGGVARMILSHELTHALDDQLYDIDGKLAPLLSERDASLAFQSVVEGSGTAMMQKWAVAHMGELDPEELQQIASMGTEGLGEAPTFLWKPLLAAYTQGQSFLNAGFSARKRVEAQQKKAARAAKKEGREAPEVVPASFTEVTRTAFETPPRSTEQVLHPEKYWDADQVDEPLKVRLDGTPEGWTRLDESTLGELLLALLVEDARTVDFTNPLALMAVRYTNDAATGWGGDRMLLLGRGDARLLYVATVWDDADEAAEFRAALEARTGAWAGKLAGLKGGVTLLPADEAAPTRVTFYAWRGLKADDAAAAAAAVEVR
ncbi:MAG: hypothetical protein H6828_01440 [Planctomycetes bacterium]|nr:hypothetical protein [Planctomycetota bacterium]